MFRMAWRNLLARKVRLVLSGFAIVIGIAFVAGSLVFTDTMSKSFDGVIKGGTPDVVVRPAGSGDDANAQIDNRTISAQSLKKLSTADGAERADGSIESMSLFVVDKNGKLVGGTGAPTISFNYNDLPSITGEPALQITQGRAPQGKNEIMLDEATAQEAGYDLGDTVSMVSSGDQPKRSATLVGTAEFGGGGLAGASLILFDTPTAQQLFLDGKDAYNSIGLTAAKGVSQDELRDNVAALAPRGVEVVTGDDVTKEAEDDIGQIINVFSAVLLVFAAIALVVGTFLIINTFSILVAQRSRELALLRALGASRRQVTRSVLGEAFVIGVVGSTAGLLAGFGLAAGLKALFAQFGLDLSQTALVFRPRTAVAAYAVGILVTMFSAYLPARRASRIAPVEAMRDDVAMADSSVRRRTVIGAVLAVLGVAAIAGGLMTDQDIGAWFVGGGSFALLFAVTALSPVLGTPVLHGLGAAYRAVFGTVGQLATQNTLRNPRRSAATASALMIGLALVSAIAVLGASVNKSIDVGVEKEFTSDYMLSNQMFEPFSVDVAEQTRQLDDVAHVAQMQWVPTTVDGDKFSLTVSDPEDFTQIYSVPMDSGSLKVDSDEIALSQSAADSLGASVGDSLTLNFPNGPIDVTVHGIYDNSNVIGDGFVSFGMIDSAGLPRFDNTVAVDAVDDDAVAHVGQQIESIVGDIPTVSVQSQADFSESQRANIDQLLNLVYALLGLAIVIAILGIINTLALSVIERTREVGLLRAVGLNRRQLRRLIRLESVAIAVLGAVLGVALGLGLGIVLQQSLTGQGVSELAIPAGRLAVFVLVAAFVGVLAAVIPARRAAKMNVLNAIAAE